MNRKRKQIYEHVCLDSSANASKHYKRANNSQDHLSSMCPYILDNILFRLSVDSLQALYVTNKSLRKVLFPFLCRNFFYKMKVWARAPSFLSKVAFEAKDIFQGQNSIMIKHVVSRSQLTGLQRVSNFLRLLPGAF